MQKPAGAGAQRPWVAFDYQIIRINHGAAPSSGLPRVPDFQNGLRCGHHWWPAAAFHTSLLWHDGLPALGVGRIPSNLLRCWAVQPRFSGVFPAFYRILPANSHGAGESVGFATDRLHRHPSPLGLRVAGHPESDGAKGVSRSSVRGAGRLGPVWYVYFPELTNGDIYVGSTNDLRRRFNSHQSGDVLSTKSTLFPLS